MMIFMVAMFIPIVPIMYFIMRNETKPKKNLIIGVTLPYLEREALAVLEICSHYKRTLGIIAIASIILAVPCFVIKSVAVSMTYLMTWLLVVIVAFPAVFAIYRGKLMRYKREHVHAPPVEPSVRVVDTATVELKTRQISGCWFLPAVIISALPTYFLWSDDTAFALAAGGTGVLLTALFYFIYRMIFRQRAELIDDRTDVTTSLTRMRRSNYGLVCIVSAWMSAIFNLLFWLWLDSIMLVMLVTVIYTVLLLALVLYAELNARKMQSKLSADSGQGFYIDDDSHWLGGLVYYNPYDKKTLINDRTGIGMGINLARPAGMSVMIFAVLCLLAMPFIGVWMLNIERTPPVLQIENGIFIASQTKNFCELPLEKIDSIEKIYDLPALKRTNGTAMDTLLTGHFTADGIGKCILSLDPTKSPFLVIRSGDNIYIVADRNPSITERVYTQMSG